MQGGWRFSRLLSQPHRMGFGAGTVLLVAGLAAWTGLLAGGVPPWASGVSLIAAHAVSLSFGFLPAFIAGFLFTVGPRWLDHPGPPVRDLRASFAALMAGWVVFALGLWVHRTLVAAGVGLAAWAFGVLALRFVRMCRASRVGEAGHARAMAAGCVVITLLQAMAALALVQGQERLARAAAVAALWGGFGVVFTAALHRMVGFLGTEAWPALDRRLPGATLWGVLVVLVLQATLVMADALREPGPDGARAVRMVVLATTGFGGLVVARRWRRTQALHRQRLLAMLHRSLVWLAVALLLEAAAQAARWRGGSGVALSTAALHALALGHLGGVLLTQVARVSAGQAGLAVAADDRLWRLFQGWQMVVAGRLAASLPGLEPVLPAVAALAALVAIGWSWRHLRWYGSPGLPQVPR